MSSVSSTLMLLSTIFSAIIGSNLDLSIYLSQKI
jgi:hypothetical protein